MNTGNTDREWEAFGKSCPYFGVISHAKFKSADTDGEARDEFFSLGEKHVSQFFSIIRENLVHDFAPRRVLDFGCGVGRLVIPLARRVDEVVGLDVSESMLDEARRNCAQAGVGNATMLRSDDQLSQLSGSFDFIHSFIVFQHIPPHRGVSILAKMLTHLAPNGVGALHFTYASDSHGLRSVFSKARAKVPYVHNFLNLAEGHPFRYPHMQMNEYDLNQIILLLQHHGCHKIFTEFSNHGGRLGVVFFFKKEELPPL